MYWLANLADSFMHLFHLGGATFMGLVTGIIPTLIVLITAINALVRIIGPERVDRAMKAFSKFWFLRYTVMPVLAVFILANPMAYTFGRFLEEKHKPAFYDAAVSFVHPILGLFPHANAGELFVWLGIATGITTLGLSLGPLAVRYFLAGVVVILLRGLVTERLTIMFMKREGK
ncbi:MAG: PTS glucitol/sorbitol transporter subunit IIC [Oscillospiraceae bacterium]|nr:PTS glucitol/sorbitol transporter subunit IIC [Oscillospiraceae bacterium]